MHTTCARSLKNLLLLGDALTGINFIAFQEDPYKLVSLGREFHGTPVVTVDFLVLENRSVFVSTDIDGIIRFFEYDPLRKSSICY
jgi:cleavage and polyadenylation specificity factor subunit 1